MKKSLAAYFGLAAVLLAVAALVAACGVAPVADLTGASANVTPSATAVWDTTDSWVNALRYQPDEAGELEGMLINPTADALHRSDGFGKPAAFGPAAARTAIPLRTPRATPTLTPEPTDLPSGNVIFSDDFSSASAGGWVQGRAQAGGAAIKNGELQIQIVPAQMLVWSNRKNVTAADFIMDVDARIADGPQSGEMGILLRMNAANGDYNFYMFGVDGKGNYNLSLRNKGKWWTLIEATPSDAIDTAPGAVNHLRISAVGDTFTLFINGELVDEIQDKTLSEGLYGVYGATARDGNLTLAFDNVVISEPGEAEPTPEPTTEPNADVVFSDDFSSPTEGGWRVKTTSDYKISIEDGQMFIQVDKPEWAVWSTNGQEIDDFVMDTDATWVDGQENGEFGVIYRLAAEGNRSTFYTFTISKIGAYSVWLFSGGRWIDLISWTPSDAVKVGEGDANHLSVVATGTTFMFFINNQFVNLLSDDTIASGQYGLYVAASADGGITASFDNFVLSKGGGE